ncbi:MAG TPA: phosphoribosylformylglycinamidine synthase subunit PurQ [Phycisphaerales bacterium]|nr:phosphoribosylformylglycinamidine synthase subunit PurQ [Phycisphaerales bacterium]
MAAPAPRALIIRAPGTNCDGELARAFTLAGATADIVHLDALIADPSAIDRADLLGLPGGFSYGDDVASGRIFAMRLRKNLYPALREAVGRGVPVFAVCNGFQIAVQAGLLPGPAAGQSWPAEPAEQEVSLTYNSGGRFIDRWVPVHAVENSVCIWTRGLQDAFRESGDGAGAEAMMLPIAHGEGRLVARDESVLERLRQNGQVALRYGAAARPAGAAVHPANPNGSSDDIVGICDTSGRVFGLMPHPERYLDWNRHPFWTRLDPGLRRGDTPGLRMFRNAVDAAVEARV